MPKTPDDPDDPDPVTPTKEKPQPGVYKFVIADNIGKAAWEAGDEILVTGGYNPGAITVKLQASDISADGKTASVNLAKVPDSVYGPDDFYAAWPAGELDLEDMFADDHFLFNTTDAPLMCAWLEGDTFSFQNICASLSFSVQGDYDGCVLSGNNWQIVRYSSWGVEVNSEYDDWVYKKGDSDYFMRKDLKNGSATLYFPNGINFSEGFNIYMRKGNSYPKVYSQASAGKLQRGTLTALGDITAQLQDYSGPAPEMPAMPKMGKSKRIEVKEVPELSGLCLTSDGSALWTVGDEGWLGQISFDGKVTKWWTKGADMEGITINPKTGDLYIACEGNQQVACVKAPEYASSSWKYIITVQEAVSGKYGNSGLEGVAYYKDDMLFVGSQVGGNVWVYTIDGQIVKRPDGSDYVSLRKLSSFVKEVGGLCYDPVNDWLWVSDSEAHKIFVFDGELTHLMAQYPVPDIHNNESVCVDHKNSCIWVGLDDDNVCAIYRIEFTGLN